MKKSLFFTFWFSLIPGAGQMYQNYMKRGLSIMGIAAILAILATMVETVIFALPLVIVFIYSFFDTFHIRNSIGTEEQKKDEYILPTEFKFDGLCNNKILGIGIIGIGVYLLLRNVLYRFAVDTELQMLVVIANTVRQYLPSIIVAAITIGIGTKMISKK